MVTTTPDRGERSAPSLCSPLRAAGFARDIAVGVVSLAAGPDAAGSASLAWPFGLSAVMRRHGAGPAEVVAMIGALRGALVDVGGLDPRSEPVPLPVADPTIQVVNGAIYLAELIGRASRAAGTTQAAVVDAAVAQVDREMALSA